MTFTRASFNEDIPRRQQIIRSDQAELLLLNTLPDSILRKKWLHDYPEIELEKKEYKITAEGYAELCTHKTGRMTLVKLFAKIHTGDNIEAAISQISRSFHVVYERASNIEVVFSTPFNNGKDSWECTHFLSDTVTWFSLRRQLVEPSGWVELPLSKWAIKYPNRVAYRMLNCPPPKLFLYNHDYLSFASIVFLFDSAFDAQANAGIIRRTFSRHVDCAITAWYEPENEPANIDFSILDGKEVYYCALCPPLAKKVIAILRALPRIKLKIIERTPPESFPLNEINILPAEDYLWQDRPRPREKPAVPLLSPWEELQSLRVDKPVLFPFAKAGRVCLFHDQSDAPIELLAGNFAVALASGKSFCRHWPVQSSGVTILFVPSANLSFFRWLLPSLGFITSDDRLTRGAATIMLKSFNAQCPPRITYHLPVEQRAVVRHIVVVTDSGRDAVCGQLLSIMAEDAVMSGISISLFVRTAEAPDRQALEKADQIYKVCPETPRRLNALGALSLKGQKGASHSGPSAATIEFASGGRAIYMPWNSSRLRLYVLAKLRANELTDNEIALLTGVSLSQVKNIKRSAGLQKTRNGKLLKPIEGR